MDVAAWLAADPQLEDGTVRARVVQAVQDSYQQKVERIGPELMRHIERDVVLRQLDQHWRDHLGAMDYLRQGIHLRGYAQKTIATSTSARPSSCSRRCWGASSTTSPRK